MIDRVIVPNQLHIVREVLNGNQTGDVDTAMFWDVIQNYTLTRAANGTITVSHTGFAQGAVVPVLPNTVFRPVSDDTDTLRNIEVLRFGDGAGGFVNFTVHDLFARPATGAAIINDTTPTEGDVLSVNTATIADENGLGPFSFQWQRSANGTTNWINVGGPTASSTFAVPDAAGTALGALANQFLRVQVSFVDGFGDTEVITSAATLRPVGANYSAAGLNTPVTFTGTAGDNIIVGGNGNDTLNGAAGNDNISGGNGVDAVNGGNGDDVLNGNAGNDTLMGNAGNDVLTGGDGNDALRGGAGTDTAIFAGAVTDYALSSTNAAILVTALAGAGGQDDLQTIETLRFGVSDYTVIMGTPGTDTINGGAGSQAIFGRGGADTLNGGAASDILNGGAANDTLNGDNGNDFIFQSSTEGRDLIDGGAGTDTYILTGDVGPETFQIYTRAAALALGINNLAANTEIVITRNGANNASIIAELDNIEEIKINTLLTSVNNGNGLVDSSVQNGLVQGDTIQVFGNFNQTSLDYSTIRIAGSNANDTVDISGLTSEHRVVFDGNGGSDAFVGGVRPQDVVTGISGVTAAALSAGSMTIGGIESDFELMELVQDANTSFAQGLLEVLTMRSGVEGGSMAMFGHFSPFDHAGGLDTFKDTMDIALRDYALV